MTELGLTPFADQIAELALEAVRAKKGARETRRRISSGVLVALMEARRSGLQQAIIVLGPGHIEAVNTINRQIEAERQSSDEAPINK